MNDFDQITEEEFKAFVGPNADCYYQHYIDMQEGKRWGFNLPAFLVAMFWLLYRKMYVELGILIVASLLIGVVEDLIVGAFGLDESMTIAVGFGINIAFAVVIAGFADTLYVNRVLRKIEQVKSTGISGQSLLDELELKGGGSHTANFFIIGAVVVAIAVIAYMNN